MRFKAWFLIWTGRCWIPKSSIAAFGWRRRGRWAIRWRTGTRDGALDGRRWAEPLLRREVCEDFDYHAVRALRRQIMEAYIDENGVEAKAGLLPMLGS